MNKILIAIPYWEQDKSQAMRVARLIADLESRHSDHADLLFMSRFDCAPADKPTLDYVSQKFNTYSKVCRRRGTGWGSGCNDLFFGVMDWVYENGIDKRIPAYKAILSFEADSCPLSPYWIGALSAAWDVSQTGRKPVKVFGPLLLEPPHPQMPKGISHINGNAMYAGDMTFLKWISRDIGGCSPHGGWDWILAPDFYRKGWADCPLIKSWWRHKNMTPEIHESLTSQGVVMMHGFKDDSVLNLVRRKFITHE